MNYQWGLQQMNFASAWDTVRGNAYVAVLDTGIKLGHADLTANFKPQLSKLLTSATTFEDELGGTGISTVHGRGTHVAGVIAANSNNSYGVTGGCWNCALMVMKISDIFNGLGTGTANVAAGITAAVDGGVQVINMSLGGYGYEDCSSTTTPLCTAISHANIRNVVMVAAAGNNYLYRRNAPGQSNSGDVQEPANQPSVIPVGALQPTSYGTRGYLWTETRVSDEFFSGSTAGPSMQSRGLVAPGFDIFSTFANGEDYNVGSFCGDNISGGTSNDGFGPCTGTSMATPHISALAGLMRSVNPWITSSQVGTFLRAAGDNSSTPD